MKKIKNNVLNTKKIPWEELKAYELNDLKEKARDSTKLKNSIINNGFNFPFYLWSGHRYVIDGTGRIKALVELEEQGYLIPNLPIVEIEAENRIEAKKKVLLVSSSHGEVTQESFNFFVEDLDLQNLDDVEFPDIFLKEPEEYRHEEEAPALREETHIRRGDIVKIKAQGMEYRIGCLDSTEEREMGELMEGDKVDLFLNDPPYGMKKEARGVANDNLNYDDLLDFNKKWISSQWQRIKENGSWYCWGIDVPLMDIYANIIKELVSEKRATFRNIITWDKGSGQGQKKETQRSYAIADEKCLFVMARVQGINDNSDNYYEEWEPIRLYIREQIKKTGMTVKEVANLLGFKTARTVGHWINKSQWALIPKEHYTFLEKYCEEGKTKAFDKEYEELKKEYDEVKKEYDEVKKEHYASRAFFDNVHDNMNNVWHFKRSLGADRPEGHPTPKPIPLCDRIIKSSSREGELVADWFSGSGSTLISAIKNKRSCYTCDIEPQYVQMTLDRATSFMTANNINYKIT